MSVHGGGESRVTVRFFKCCLWCIAILRSGLEINICKVLLGGGHQEKYSVCALDNVDTSGRTLN